MNRRRARATKNPPASSSGVVDTRLLAASIELNVGGDDTCKGGPGVGTGTTCKPETGIP
ncbi:MAG: hypothetical protein GY720_08050 [bacterium]|nr:hypothetical protein [bacterium]